MTKYATSELIVGLEALVLGVMLHMRNRGMKTTRASDSSKTLDWVLGMNIGIEGRYVLPA
jgi:hypothetical protein